MNPFQSSTNYREQQKIKGPGFTYGEVVVLEKIEDLTEAPVGYREGVFCVERVFPEEAAI